MDRVTAIGIVERAGRPTSAACHEEPEEARCGADSLLQYRSTTGHRYGPRRSDRPQLHWFGAFQPPRLHPCTVASSRGRGGPRERHLLSEWLREAGYQCCAFDQGETLLRIDALDRFDALVVGNLRGTSGIQVLAHIRGREKCWVPILFVGDGRCESDVVAALRKVRTTT